VPQTYVTTVHKKEVMAPNCAVIGILNQLFSYVTNMEALVMLCKSQQAYP
jgi:hypothetical protein